MSEAMFTVETMREHDTTAPAPGVLELVQRFMNLHEHNPRGAGDLPPSTELVRGFLVDRGLLEEADRLTTRDMRRAMALYEALHAKGLRNLGRPIPPDQIGVIEKAAHEAGLIPRFEPDGPPWLEPAAGGVTGALGRLVAIVFLAELDGSWASMKECGDPRCRSTFFDRSKNHSGRWCSMSRCGNRAKARAWRERRSDRDDDRT